MECPALSNSHHYQGDDGPDDEKTDKRHDAVEVPPPPCAFVPRLVEDTDLMGEVDVAEVA